MLDIKRLQYLEAVYRYHNFTRASEELFVSQSAISMAIKSLEADLGVRLIVRSPQSVAFTYEGEQLVQHARRILLECENAEAKFTHVPDWYAWERACVREELEQGSYLLDAPVSICVMVNFRQICRVGEGRLRHDANGFRLTGCGGKLDFTQKPETSYSLYADYFWYELGDMICIGDRDVLYYCFPQGKGDVVAKTRLAAEELYKLKRAERAAKNG